MLPLAARNSRVLLFCLVACGRLEYEPQQSPKDGAIEDGSLPLEDAGNTDGAGLPECPHYQSERFGQGYPYLEKCCYEAGLISDATLNCDLFCAELEGDWSCHESMTGNCLDPQPSNRDCSSRLLSITDLCLCDPAP